MRNRRIIPECPVGETLKFQGITEHLYSTIPQRILAQVQSDQALVAAEGRCENLTAEGGDGTSPQPIGETQKLVNSFNQCLQKPSYMPGTLLGVGGPTRNNRNLFPLSSCTNTK